MVIGIDKFREHFANFEDNYIVIGGAACDWLMSHTPGSIPFRATHDIDLVICAETMTPAFVSAVWNFVRDGGYSVYERKDGQKSFFRFLNPSAPGYPSMLEFFAREPLNFPLVEKTTIIPIPVGDDISSLSGILLDENYYSFIRSLRRTVGGLCVLSTEALLLLKARAWKDFTDRKSRGEFVKDKDLRKHRLDIIRLLATIPEATRIHIPQPLHNDFADFLAAYEQNPTDPTALEISMTFDEVLARLRTLYITD